MLEFDYDQTRNTETTTDTQAQEENKVSPLGFTSDADERKWMDQVRRECAKSYTDRIR